MSTAKDKEQLYINIAKACLAAINKHADQSPQDAYEQVYLAIDQAIQDEFGKILKTFERQQHALQSIANLTPDQIAQAPDIAEAALHEQH